MTGKFRSIAALLILAAACSCTPQYVRFGGYAQGGIYSVQYCTEGVCVPPEKVRQAVDSILLEIDNTLSGYNKGSLLSRYNAGQNPELTPMFREVLAIGEEYCLKTGGAIDVQSAALFDVWGFGFTRDSMPSEQTVREAMASRGKKLNFNAIAQGYSCDAVASYLRGIGVGAMLVDIGEIWCCGLNPSGQPWQIGIDNPSDGNDTPGKDLRAVWKAPSAEGRGIVTSGNYRKYYIHDGKKYAHTIDPRSGYPVQHSLLSATVVAPTASQADALATAFMVMGPSEARRYVLEDPSVEAFLVCADSVWASPGFFVNSQPQ